MHFPKPAKPFNGWAGACGWRHGRLPLEGILPGTVTWTLLLMWSSPVTGHLGGFQVFWEFSAFSIRIELLLAVQTNYRGRRTLRSSVLHGLGQPAGHWRDEWWTWKWREEQKMRKESEKPQLGFVKSLRGLSLVMMSGDWKKRTKFHKAIWIRYNCIWTIKIVHYITIS